MNSSDKEHIELIIKQTQKASSQLPDLEVVSLMGFYRLHQVLAILPMSKSSWYAGIQSGIFPSGINIGNRITFWLKTEILLLQQKIL